MDTKDGRTVEALATEILAGSVALVGGRPRRQQLAVVQAICDHDASADRLATEAPTGSGKSLAYLSALAAMRVIDGKKSLVSTETKQLQAQIVHKDLPVVIEATKTITGVTIQGAVLRGRQNYVCQLAVAEYLGLPEDHEFPNHEIANIAGPQSQDFVRVWLASQYGKPSWDGSTDEMPLNDETFGEDFARLSVSAAGCIGDLCAFRKQGRCFADLALDQVEEADIVVTNHTMLAIELTKKVPAAFGRGDRNPSVLVIDEAHALPATVRSNESQVANPHVAVAAAKHAGASFASAAQIAAVSERGRGLNQLLGLASKINVTADKYQTSNQTLHGRLDTAILHFVSALEAVVRKIPPKIPSNVAPLARLTEQIDRFQAVLSASEDTALWSEADGHYGFQLVSQSIAISNRLSFALNEMVGENKQIVALSATLPEQLAKDMLGRDTRYISLESPFASAFAESGLYIPVSNQQKFDFENHLYFSVEQIIVPLVQANEGSALVLMSSAKGAQVCVKELKRRFTGMNIHFYKDSSSRVVVDRWKKDTGSVLVATRGMMTGVDAPGETCSLVIVDRVPRAYKSIVNEMRVHALTQRDVDDYVATALVYGSDAQILLEQAAGRLIRSESDRGLLAILDPRLNPLSECAYRPPYSSMYREAIGKWGTNINDLDDAIMFIKGRKA